MNISGIAESVRRVREWLRDNEYARADIPYFLISHIAHEILPIFHDILLTEAEKLEAELEKPQPAEAQEKISKGSEEKSLKERLLGAFEWARVFSAALDPKSYKGGLIMPEVPEDISKALEEVVESAWKERFGGDEKLQRLRNEYVRHNGEERAGALLLRRLTHELGGTLGGQTISDEKMAELRGRAEELKAKYEARREKTRKLTRKL